MAKRGEVLAENGVPMPAAGASESKITRGIAYADRDQRLLMMPSSKSECCCHLISLVQATALALELSRQVYWTGLRSNLGDKPKTVQSLSFRIQLRFRHKPYVLSQPEES